MRAIRWVTTWKGESMRAVRMWRAILGHGETRVQMARGRGKGLCFVCACLRCLQDARWKGERMMLPRTWACCHTLACAAELAYGHKEGTVWPHTARARCVMYS